jgi:hypothetical protein
MLHIKTKRQMFIGVLCGRAVSGFSKVYSSEVEDLIKRHGTEKYFCKLCLKKWKEKQIRKKRKTQRQKRNPLCKVWPRCDCIMQGRASDCDDVT